MKKLIGAVLAGIILLSLFGCQYKESVQYGTPIALYKDGKSVIELGMSKDAVIDILGKPEDEQKFERKEKIFTLLYYGSIEVVIDNDEVCAIDFSDEQYSDYIGNKPGTERLKHSEVLDDEEIYFDENCNNLVGNAKTEHRKKYILSYTTNKADKKLIERITIMTEDIRKTLN